MKKLTRCTVPVRKESVVTPSQECLLTYYLYRAIILLGGPMTGTTRVVSSKASLWNGIQNYHFNHLVPLHLTDRVSELFGGADAATKAFATKIAAKHSWRINFALRVISEYRRFVYLGVVSESMVVPSTIIDVVWHEHQLFTEAYRMFCKGTLGRNFDHNPSLLSDTEQTEVYNAHYRYTLELYEKEFGVVPPSDIWGTPKFDEKDVKGTYEVKRRKREDVELDIDLLPDFINQDPLHTVFDIQPVQEVAHAHHAHDTFDGGRSGGAGASGSWNTTHHQADGHGHSADSGHADSGHSSSDAGGSGDSGGGSSCSSSSCGGGGCGGGCGG